jgi:chromosome segregation ATPase
MGRPSNVTYELIGRIATNLINEKKPCTIISIHKITGGSLGTVSKHFKQWKENEGLENFKKLQPKDLSVDVNSIIKIELARLAKETNDLCEAKINEKDEEIVYLQKNLELSENIIAELENKNNSLFSDYQFMSGEKHSAEMRLKEMEEKFSKMEEEIYEASREVARSDGALNELREYLNSKLTDFFNEIRTYLSSNKNKLK